MSRPRRCSAALLLVTLLILAPRFHAQSPGSALTDREIEKLRDAAYLPNDRVLVFLDFLDQRTAAIRTLMAHPRKPGREQDIHDLLEQFTSIANELSDNLDDYDTRHGDVRKALPKLLNASERWSTDIKTAPDDAAYTVSRKIALEALRDLREQATALVESQRAWFLAHPPVKNRNQPLDWMGQGSRTPPVSP